MNYDLGFLMNQLINWLFYAVSYIPSGSAYPLGHNLQGIADWYTYAYLYIGESFPLGDLLFWTVQIFR